MAFPAGWGLSAKLTVQAAQVPSSQTNFPVWVNDAVIRVANPTALTSGGGAAFKSDGGDVRFSSDVDGAIQLAFQIQDCTLNADQLLSTFSAFVKFPTISNGSEIYIWWLKSDADLLASSDTYGSINVWESYAAVAHLDEADAVINLPLVSQPQLIDSKTATAKFYNAQVQIVPTDVLYSASQTGKVHKALYWGGNGALEMTGSESSMVRTVGENFSFSSFVRPAEVSKLVGIFVTKGDTYDSPVQFRLNYEVRRVNLKLEFIFRNSTNTAYARWASTDDIFAIDTWYHIGVSITYGTAASLVISVNGAAIAGSWIEGTGSESPNTRPDPVWFANGVIVASPGLDRSFQGRMDEIRISSASLAFSQNYFTTEFNNLNSPTTFIVMAVGEGPKYGIKSGHEGWVSIFEDDWLGGTGHSFPQPLYVDKDDLTFGKEIITRDKAIAGARVTDASGVVYKAAKPSGGLTYQFRSSDLLKVLYSHFQLGSVGSNNTPYRYHFYPKKEPLDWSNRGPHPSGVYGAASGQPYSVSVLKKMLDPSGQYHGTNSFFFKHAICDKLGFNMVVSDDAKVEAQFKFRDLDYGTAVSQNPNSNEVGTYATTPSFMSWSATVNMADLPIEVSSFKLMSDQGAQEFNHLGRQAPENFNLSQYKLTGEFAFDLPLDALKEVGSMFGSQTFSFVATLFNGTSDRVIFELPTCVRMPFDYSAQSGAESIKASIPFEAYGSAGNYPIRVTVDTEYLFNGLLIFGDGGLGARTLGDYGLYDAGLGARTLSEYTYYNRD